jgi:natural product precursor
MKKIKKLSLNKEVISSLQEKQMKSLMGGAALASKGKTAAYTCGGDSCAICPVSVYTCPIQNLVEEPQPPSCCQNSCN